MTIPDTLASDTRDALLAKMRAAPFTATIDDETLAGIVSTVVADTLLIAGGQMTPEEFRP